MVDTKKVFLKAATGVPVISCECPGGGFREGLYSNSDLLQARATLGYREKKMPPGKVYVSHVYYRIYKYIYIYLMITRSLSRWHSRSSAWLGSISNASTT